MELASRCFVARGIQQESQRVVGIATENEDGPEGYSYVLHLLEMNDWTEADQQRMEEGREKLGYFQQPRITRTQEREYPIDE